MTRVNLLACCLGTRTRAGDEGTHGVGVPRHVVREPRLLEERDGAGDTRDRADVRRQAGHDEDGYGVAVQSQGRVH